MTVGQCLRAFRLQAGMMQYEATQAMKVGYNSIANWESDKCKITFENAVRLCRLYNKSVEVLAATVEDVKNGQAKEERLC